MVAMPDSNVQAFRPTKRVRVQLTGVDGDSFAIVGRVSAALKREGFRKEADAFVVVAVSCRSCAELLELAEQLVTVV
jgi:hypothetical protein